MLFFISSVCLITFHSTSFFLVYSMAWILSISDVLFLLFFVCVVLLLSTVLLSIKCFFLLLLSCIRNERKSAVMLIKNHYMDERTTSTSFSSLHSFIYIFCVFFCSSFIFLFFWLTGYALLLSYTTTVWCVCLDKHEGRWKWGEEKERETEKSEMVPTAGTWINQARPFAITVFINISWLCLITFVNKYRLFEAPVCDFFLNNFNKKKKDWTLLACTSKHINEIESFIMARGNRLSKY